MISFDPLLKTMIDKKITRTQMREMLGISSATFARITRSENISSYLINRICNSLNCGLSDVIEYIPDEEAENIVPETK